MACPGRCVRQISSQDPLIEKKPPQVLADRFVEYLTEKILKIRSVFSASANLQHITPDSPPPMFSTFSTVTEDQLTKSITNSPSKSCFLDP